ncbi:MAG: TraR/DksA C4-type zinc finger protein [Patescibacteria group bacterium]|nr:TraR/DksA C4-type zinc finger protein [Patescibacteria group bacterium]
MDKKLSKKFIQEQKEKLLSDKEKSLRQIDELKKEDPFADPDHASDNAAVDTDVREQMGHETIEAQINDLQKKVSDIDNALRKIQKNQYGICERCKKNIPQARLKLIPEASYCIDCEKRLRK